MNTDNERRLLIAVILTFGLLMVWRFMFPPPPPQHPKPHPIAQAEKQGAPAPARHVQAKPAPPKVALKVVTGSEARQIVVESPLYRITLSTQGAVIRSWILKNYQDGHNKPLDVVNTAACAQLGYPMSLELADSTVASELNSSIYLAQPSGAVLEAPQDITFTYSNGKVRVRKEFLFGPQYQIRVRVSVFDGQRDVPVAVKWPGDIGDQSVPFDVREKLTGIFYDQGAGIKTVEQKKVDGAHVIPGPLIAAGVQDHFFAGIFLPESPREVFRYAREAWRPAQGNALLRPITAMLGTPAAEPLTFRLSAVPKELSVLRAENPVLPSLVDFGIMGVAAKPLLLALRWTYDHVVHNWGWAIVLLTVVLNMIFFPLRIKSVRSAQAMQRIAPLMKEIQNRYKQYKFNDPRKQRMNQEVMKLYQEHGINPLSGCLPMLPQIPIFWAFYEVLETSIALRHAPWIWWVKDLSAPDPLYILPTLGIIISFIMTKMTPMPSTDPAQQRMMLIMPIFVGIIFYKLAAGDTLYYLTYSLLGIFMQLWINRMVPPVKGQAVPAADQGKGQAPPPGGGRPKPPGRRRPVPIKG